MTVDEFFWLVEHRPRKLRHGLTWKAHWSPTSHWITPNEYNKSVVVLYDANIGYFLPQFFNHTEHTCKRSEIPITNPTSFKAKKERVKWTNTLRETIKRIFSRDFDLVDAIEKEPHRFALVIKPPG